MGRGGAAVRRRRCRTDGWLTSKHHRALIDAEFVLNNLRAHGRDERLGVESFYKGNEFFYQYLRALTTP
jgi:acetylornithine deacetylase/succinyl-diaminopimelate desuccinylase-like protein